MKKVYTVCPRCLKVEEFGERTNWFETFKVLVTYMTGMKNGKVVWTKVEEGDIVEHVETLHGTCKSVIKGFAPEDFMIVVEDGEIKEVGYYWEEEEDPPVKVLKEAKILK